MHLLRPTANAALLLLALAGCSSGADKSGDTGPSEAEDIDGDGYAGSDDCDQFDAAVHPGAAEVCDGVDNDCDGVVDPSSATDATTWYADLDGDGAGDPANATAACEQPSDYVLNGADCDDTHAEVYPGHPEVCDGLDNDCDNEVDPPSASGTGSFYGDADGDGYGDGAVQTVGCTAPDGYVDDHTDCDDTNPAVHPTADEVCDGLDDDCDGAIDPDTSSDAGTWYRDGDTDGFGADDDVRVTCTQPAGYAPVGGDCDDDDDAAYPGGAEVCDGADNDCDGQVDPPTADDAATWYGDADGDGYAGADLAVLACDAPSGYAATASDCADTDAAIHPGATETCNGVDDDCNGSVDPDTSVGAPTWHPDRDSDTFGDSATSRAACTLPVGYVADGTDCDDADPAAYPGGLEVCDGADNDCDGTTDPGTSIGAATYYADVDRDSYGDPASATAACSAPIGYVTDNRDCDDTSASAHPGGVEVCDGVDDDCDGVVDPSTSSGAPTWYADQDVDGYGDPATGTTACTSPAGYTTNATDCGPTDPSIHPGATDIPYDGVDQDCTGDDGTCTDDDLGSAVGSIIATGSTTTAGADVTSSCGGASGQDVTYHWVAPSSGYYRVTTAGSSFDTIISAFVGDCSGTEVTCNDDADTTFTSALTIETASGDDWEFAVDGYDALGGTYVVNIEQLDPAECTTGFDLDGDSLIDCLDSDCDATAACSTALADYDLGSVMGTAIASGTTRGATDNWGTSCLTSLPTAADIVYAWTAPAAGRYSFSTAGSRFDTLITLYQTDGINELDCTDDDSLSIATSTAYHTMRAGETILIVIDGYNGASGVYYLGISSY